MQPGSVEVDLVRYEGVNTRGDCTHTLDAPDVRTTWTKTETVRHRPQVHVFGDQEKALLGSHLRFKLSIRTTYH